MRRLLTVVALTFILSGCYRATVHTGLAPSASKVEKSWAHGFLWGLVPPSDLDAGGACPNGVARTETELSFLNQVAAGLTWGIYTPMTLRAVCAQ